MAAIQWAVFIVANHTRRELLAESASVRDDRMPGQWDERSVSGTALARHWDFKEDRMKVVGTVPVDNAVQARLLAHRLRWDVVQLGFHSPWTWRLVGDGYRLLGGGERRGGGWRGAEGRASD